MSGISWVEKSWAEKPWVEKSWLAATLPRRARESRLLALLGPIFRHEARAPANAIVLKETLTATADDRDHDGHGWTVGLRRGGDLPRLRLSILPQSGAGVTLRFDPCPAFPDARPDRF